MAHCKGVLAVYLNLPTAMGSIHFWFGPKTFMKLEKDVNNVLNNNEIEAIKAR